MVSRNEQEVRIFTAPESWAEYFRHGAHVVPEWMEEQDIHEGRAAAAELQQLLGESFTAEYSPNSCFDEDDASDSMGHIVGVGVSHDFDDELANRGWDLRENYREQIADWLGKVASQFNQARHRLLAAEHPRRPADDEAVVTMFEAIDTSTGRLLYRSLVESDCRDFARATPSPCEVRRRDALLCSARSSSGAA